MPGVPQPRGHPERDHRVGAREVGHEDGRGGRRRLEPARLVHQGEQPVEADRGPDARQPPRREEAGEVVVSSPRGDAAELLPALDGGLEDDARVVVEAAGQAEVDGDPVLGNARGVEQVEHGPEVGDPLAGVGVRAERGLGLAEHVHAAPAGLGELERPGSACSAVSPAPPSSGWLLELVAAPPSRPIFASLSSDRSTGPLRPERPSDSSMPSRILRLLSVIVKSGTPAAARAEWITWAISASASTLSVPIVSKSHCTNSRNRPLAGRSPRKTEPIAYRLKGTPELVDVLGDEPGQGHGQVEPEGELAGRAPLVGDLEDLPQDLVRPGPLAGQDLHPLDVRRLDRQEAEARRTSGGTPPSIRSRGIITAGGRSRSPLATRGSIMTVVSLTYSRHDTSVVAGRD